MANMSYCRFENTAADLQDCYENWPCDPEDLSSDYERAGFDRLLRLCEDIVRDYGEVD